MANHVKPTREELKAAAEAALAEDERLAAEEAAAANNPQPTPSQAVPSPSAPVPSPSAPVPSPSAPIPSPSKPVPSAGVPGSTDWKKRYTDSSREAKVLAVKNRELNQVVDEAAGLPEPTDEEMIEEYAEWEEMTTTEQHLAKNDLLNKRRFDLIHSATQKYKKIDDWNERVDKFVDDPKTMIANQELEGKQEEFRLFASKPTRAGMDFEDLVLAFLGDEAKKVKPNHKGEKMFEQGTGGSSDTPPIPDDKFSVEQAIIDRKTNYQLYKERLKNKKYKTE